MALNELLYKHAICKEQQSKARTSASNLMQAGGHAVACNMLQHDNCRLTLSGVLPHQSSPWLCCACAPVAANDCSPILDDCR